MPEEPIEGAWNLALRRSVTASSVANDAGPELTVDGETGAPQWNSEDMKNGSTTENDPQEPQWLRVDLGASGSRIDRIKLFYNMKVWPMVYEIQTSDTPGDNDSWETVVRVERSPYNGNVKNAFGQTIADETENMDTITTTSVPSLEMTGLKRYVRFYCEKVNTAAGGHNVNLREIEIYGVNENRHPPVDLAEVLALATASTVTAEGESVALPQAPDGAVLTVAGSSLKNVVGRDGVIGGKNIGPRDVTLLIRAWDVDDPAGYEEKNVTVAVPDHKDSYPAEWFPSVANPNPKPEVIPTIQEWYGYEGSAALTENSRIVFHDPANVGLQKAAEHMREDLAEICGLELPVVGGEDAGPGDIYMESLISDMYDLGDEGYLMRIHNGGVSIWANTYTGGLYGTITAEQILWQAEDRRTLPHGILRDYPAYEVRGIKLDVARTPYRYQQLKDYARIMLWYKMSEYDLHINDNDNANIDKGQATFDTHSGFHRLESETFPSLAAMSGTKHAGIPAELINEDYYNNNADYQGNPVYTKEQWSELAELTRGNGMRFLTEIDLPAHSLIYNQYARENPDAIDWLQGGTMPGESFTNNAGYLELLDLTGANKDRTLRFAKELWGEYTGGDEPVISGDVVHIGADEYWVHDTATNNAFALFADEMRKVIQENLGADTKIRMWGASTSSGSFRTAPQALNTTHAELARHYQLDVWSTAYENPEQRVREGYELVNCRDSFVYGNPGRGRRDVPNAEYLFYDWAPTMFGGTTLLLGEPNLLGAKVVIWGDQSQEGMTERDIHQRVLRSIAILSEKTWGGTEEDDTFSEYELRAARLAEGPGTQIAMELPSETSLVLDYDFHNLSTDGSTVFDASGNGYDGTVSGGTADGEGWLAFDGNTLISTPLKTLSYPYTLSFDLKLGAGNDEESSLFSGRDGRVQAAGHNGKLSADVNYFTRDLDYTLPTDGTAVNITIVGTFQAVRLYVDGRLVTFLSQKQDQDGIAPGSVTTLYSSVLLPLEKIGQGFYGEMAHVKVYNKALSAQEVADGVAGTDDGLVNVAQNALAGGDSYAPGDGGGQDNAVQRVCIAMKAVDGEAFTADTGDDSSEMWSYWQGDHADSSLTLDLGQTRAISRIDIQWRSDGIGSGVKFQASEDGKVWRDIKTVSGNTEARQSVLLDAPVETRYLRMQGVSGSRYRLQELLAYESVDKTELVDKLLEAEKTAAERGLGFESEGERDRAFFAAIVLARAVKESPLSTRSDVEKALARLEEAGREPTPVSVTGVKLEKEQISLKVGEKTVLSALVEPADAANKAVAWSSDNMVVAEVKDGEITALSAGRAVITVITDDGGFTAACVVTVTEPEPEKPEKPAEPEKPSVPSGGGGGWSGSGGPATEKNKDGSTTTTRIDTATGTVTKTTQWPDGTEEVVVTRKDGSTVRTITDPTGKKVEKAVTADKDVTITVTGAEGEQVVRAELPAVVPAPEKSFVDVPRDHWAWEAVQTVAGLGLVKGVGEDRYDARALMTRGSLATVLCRLSNGAPSGETDFADVDRKGWYADGISWAAKNSVVQGVGGVGQKLFWPNDVITREQLAVMLCRYAGLLGMNTQAERDGLDQFGDGAQISEWALDEVAWCVEKGILRGKGNGTLDPGADVSRGEVAIMLQRFVELMR